MATGIALGVAGFGARQCLAGGTVAFAMTGWASNALPEVTTGLAFFALAALGHVAPPGVIFTGFASSAFWLVLGGMVVAQAMTRSGLGRRIANRVAAETGPGHRLRDHHAAEHQPERRRGEAREDHAGRSHMAQRGECKKGEAGRDFRERVAGPAGHC